MALLDNAQKDSLTMCYTKDALAPFLDKSKAEYSAYKIPFSVLLIDIDGFKTFNDKHGHIFGDEALKYFSSSLRLNLDDEDCTIFRFGGDEFVLVFPGRTSKEVYRLAARIENNIRRRPFLFKGREYKISFSGGIASCPADSIEMQGILEKADKAMYFSKRRGHGRIAQYARMRSELLKRLIKAAFAIALVLSAIAITRYVFHIDMDAIHGKIKLLRKGLPLTTASSSVKVYLKSGNTIKGSITRETDDDMSLSFDMAVGEGSVIIKKSDIQYIDRDYKD